MTVAPVIETGRLRLRPLREADLVTWSAVTADQQVVRYLGGSTLSREETWRRILATAGAWPVLGFGYWAVEARAGGPMIGHVGFADFKRDMEPSIDGLPEMGWVFAPAAQGQGYAGEAVAAALDWADRGMAPDEVVAIVDPGNARSIRIAERAGFALCEDATYRNEPILLFRRLRGRCLR
jgi:RimJ/RimL family protein N-acetyltransferase